MSAVSHSVSGRPLLTSLTGRLSTRRPPEHLPFLLDDSILQALRRSNTFICIIHLTQHRYSQI